MVVGIGTRLHVVAQGRAEDAGLAVLVDPRHGVDLAAGGALGGEQGRGGGHHLHGVVQLVAGRLPIIGEAAEDGVVPGLSTLFKQANLPFCISCSETDTRPQFLFSHMVGAGTRDQKSLRLGESHPKQIHIFVSSQGTGHGLFTAGKRRGIEQHQIIAAPSPFQFSHLLKRIRRSIDTSIGHLV